MKVVRYLVVVAALVAVVSSVSALPIQRTFVSATSGTDSNPCTRALPCRNFAAAITLTQPGGEVVVLDSGGYGVVVINQAVALEAPDGVTAGITVFSGTAIDVAAGPTDIVIVRGLTINGLGGDNGIVFEAGHSLSVGNCVISRVALFGVLAVNAGPLFLKDTTIIGAQIAGVQVGGSSSVVVGAVIDHCRIEGPGGSGDGLSNGTNGHTTINDSMIVNADQGIVSGTASQFPSDVLVERCVVSSNTVGIHGTAGGGITKIRVSNSTITHNGTGVLSDNVDQGAVLTRINNSLEANSVDGSFSGPYSPK